MPQRKRTTKARNPGSKYSYSVLRGISETPGVSWEASVNPFWPWHVGRDRSKCQPQLGAACDVCVR